MQRVKTAQLPWWLNAAYRLRTVAVWIGLPLLTWFVIAANVPTPLRIGLTAVAAVAGVIVGGGWYVLSVTRFEVNKSIAERRREWEE